MSDTLGRVEYLRVDGFVPNLPGAESLKFGGLTQGFTYRVEHVSDHHVKLHSRGGKWSNTFDMRTLLNCCYISEVDDWPELVCPPRESKRIPLSATFLRDVWVTALIHRGAPSQADLVLDQVRKAWDEGKFHA